MQLPSLHRVDGKNIAYDTHLQAAGLDINRNGVAGFIFRKRDLFAHHALQVLFAWLSLLGNGLDNSIISIYNDN